MILVKKKHIFRKTLLLSALFLFALLFFFPKASILAFVKWQMQRYCHSVFGRECSYKSFAWEGTKIVVSEGRIIKGEKELLTFSTASLEPKFDWKHLLIKAKLVIHELHVDMQKKSSSRVSFRFSKFPFLELESYVERGTVGLSEQAISFSLSHTSKRGASFGSIQIKGEDDPLIINFEKNTKGYCLIKPHFSSHSFSQLYEMMTFFVPLSETMQDWQLLRGKMSGSPVISLHHGKILGIKGDVFFSDIHVEHPPLGLLCEMDHFNALLDIDLRSVSTMNAEFSLQGGSCLFQQKGWDLCKMHSTITLKEGKLETTALRGSLLGMDGEIVLDWHSPHQLMEIAFDGNALSLSSLFPEKFKGKFLNAFQNDAVSLKASLGRSEDGLQLEGSLFVTPSDGGMHELEFGCLFEKSEKVELPANLLEHLTHQFCLSRKHLGWFRGKQFPMEKFFSPFFLQDYQLQVKGTADFEGTFDDQQLVIFYEQNGFYLDGPHFTLEDVIPTNAVCMHSIHLKTGAHEGFLPLKAASFMQKSNGFTLKQTSAFIHFDNNHIHIDDIDAYYDSLVMKGNVEIDIQSVSEITLNIHADSFSGPAVEASRLIHCFIPTFSMDHFKIGGSVEALSDALHFNCQFTSGKKNYTCKIQGNLCGCSYQNTFFSVEEFNGSIFYDSCSKEVRIANGQGDILIPSAKRKAKLTMPSVIFSELPLFQIAFELQLIDFDEMISLSGKSIATESGGRSIICEGLSKLGETLTFQASQENNQMEILECHFGKWLGKGALAWEKGRFAFNDISLETNEEEKLCFSGFYDLAGHKLKGNVDHFRWNLTSAFEKNLSSWRPKGSFSGSGAVEWCYEKGLEGYFHTSFHDLSIGSIHFGSGENLRCFYSNQRGLSIEGLAVEIPFGEGIESYKLGRFCYDFLRKKLTLEALDFSLPPEKLPWAAELIGQFFSQKMPSQMTDKIKKLKQEMPLEGSLSLEIYPETLWLSLNLVEGDYFIDEKKVDIRSFTLNYDPLDLNVWTQCVHKTAPYWVHFSCDSKTMRRGKIAVSKKELSAERLEGFDSLIAKWELTRERGLLIHSIEGSLVGLDVSLASTKKANASDNFQLKGRISFDPKQIDHFLSEENRAKLAKLSLAGFCSLEGNWVIPKKDFANVQFSGIFSMREFQVGGVKFDTCSADCIYSPGLCICSNLTIKDWAGRICVDQVYLEKQKNNAWKLDVDQLMIEDFRLSRLRSPWTTWEPREKPFFRSLFISTLALHDFSMTTDDLTSTVGYGCLEFTTLPKRSLLSHLLLLPTEITGRIGLDFSNLVPAKGTIFFEARQGKICLTDFKEMYSDGKRSRFYLAEGTQAYIDFKGNLNIKVKMKQYNLLLKLAEFFTVSVKGSLLHPSIAFLKQDSRCG